MSCIVQFGVAVTPRQRAVRLLSGVRIFGFNAFGTMLKQLRASAPFLHSSRTKDTPICPQNSDDWADAIVTTEKVKNDRSRREGLLHHRLSHVNLITSRASMCACATNCSTGR